MMSSNDVHGVQLYYSHHHQNAHLTWPDYVEEETCAQVCSSVFVFLRHIITFKKLKKQKKLHATSRAAGPPSLIVVIIRILFP